MLLFIVLSVAVGAQQGSPHVVSSARQHLARAESALRAQDRVRAEREYRAAAEVALNSLGLLDFNRGRFDEALRTFEEASRVAAEPRSSLLNLSATHVRRGKAEEALPILREILARHPADLTARRMLGQALDAAGQKEEAVAELNQVLAVEPDNGELIYMLARIQLGLRQPNQAAASFERLKRLRPMAATHVLVGRTYRDFRYFAEAEKELRHALRLDPGARRAHYYLGTVYLRQEGGPHVEQAAAELEKELRMSPADYLSNLNLGLIHEFAREHAAAIPLLLRAIKAAPEEPAPHFYLGRAYHFTGRFSSAIASLKEALWLAEGSSPYKALLGDSHYILAQSYRRLGREKEALAHYAKAHEVKTEVGRTQQERLRQYLSGETESADSSADTPGMAEPVTPVSPKSIRAENNLRRENQTVAARAYFNLGTLQALEAQFQRAAAFFQLAANWEPTFPSVQYSLGLSLYNAQQYPDAIIALERAVQAAPGDLRARRLLGLVCFHTEQFERASSLLADAQFKSDSSVQYALGISLVRSGKPAEAAQVFDQLLESPSTSPEILVLLGQAHAQQNDYDGALALFRRALERKPNTPEAHYSAGQIHLRSGRLAEAEHEFRQELQIQAADAKTRYHLAYVLVQEQRTDEAMLLLSEVLQTQPTYADARYLLGKIYMDRDQPGPAAEQLEAAVNLAPEKPHLRYQLAHAYQKLGRTQDAEREFARFRELRQKEQQDESRRNPQ